MKRGRGRPPKTPVYSSKLLKSNRRGSQHGGQTSTRVCSPQLGDGVKTRESNRSNQRRSYFEGIQFSDSDSDSDSSYGSSVSSVRSYKIPRVIPMKTVTPLPLPPSSDDIILPPEYVLQGLAIYEVLRQFGRILRLSPFRFEDFCAAIDSSEQSALLSQIHMALFRALLQEDETNGYTFAASDEKDSLNIFLHEVDCFTWPEHIISYFFSDKTEFGDLLDTIKGRDPQHPFPFVSINDRLKVLQRLCDLFLASNTVREVIINEGIVESEDHCRNCSKMGDLLCCETCPAVYHLHCLKPPLEVVPEGDWLCPICDIQQLKGVTDCQPAWIKDGWLRHTPLGTDRQGRKYWFLSRRLFV